MIKAALLAAAVALLTGTALAETDAGASARAAIEALQAAGDALAQAEGARDRVAALTETVRAYEAGLAALREGLRHATIRERAIEGAFAAESDRLSRLLGVLQTIEAAPETNLLLHPGVRSGRCGRG